MHPLDSCRQVADWSLLSSDAAKIQFGNSKVTVCKENDELSGYLCTLLLSIPDCTFFFLPRLSIWTSQGVP